MAQYRRQRRRPHQRYQRTRPVRHSREYAKVPELTGTDGGIAVNSTAEELMEYMPALFNRFPELAETLGWVSLRGVSDPTRPARLQKSQHLFGENYVFLKQESLDFHIMPENSAKKLEFILGSPEFEDVKTLIASGPAGDFHCLAVAKAAQELGKKCEIVMRHSRATTKQIQAIMAMMNLGARVRMRETDRWFQFTMWWKNFLSRFFSQSIVPEGGASGEGVLGYVSAMAELEAQIRQGLIPEPDYLVVPVLTGTSLVGFEVGKRLLGLPRIRIQGIATRCESQSLRPEMAELAADAIEILKEVLPSSKGLSLSEKDFFVDFSVNDLKPLSEDIQRWLVRFFELEQCEMDMEITGRALYGMNRWIEKKNLKGQKILFWSISSPFRSGDLGNFQGYENIPGKLKRWIRNEQRSGRLYDIGRL